MAVQPWLGLLPKRSSGIDSANRGYPCVAAIHLANQFIAILSQRQVGLLPRERLTGAPGIIKTGSTARARGKLKVLFMPGKFQPDRLFLN